MSKKEFEHAVELDVSGLMASSITTEGYNPDNYLIRTGTVQINKLSSYLIDLDSAAKGSLLVARHDLAKSDNLGLGTWLTSVARVRNIEYAGFRGMQIYDRCENTTKEKGVIYEEGVAQRIRAAVEWVKQNRKTITTNLFIPPLQLVCGSGIDSDNIIITVPNNLFDLRKVLAEHGGAFLRESGEQFDYADGQDEFYQLTCTEVPDHPEGVFSVVFGENPGIGGVGRKKWLRKGEYSKGNGDDTYVTQDDASSRLVALEIQPF